MELMLGYGWNAGHIVDLDLIAVIMTLIWVVRPSYDYKVPVR